jgi:Ca2+-binding EF-hand superfamily protein
MNNKTIIKLATLGLSTLIASAAVAAPNYEKSFSRIDKDGDGSISVEELAHNWAENAKKKGNEKAVASASKRATARVKKGDTDGDGALSKEEFIASAKMAKGKGKDKKNK